MPKTVKPTANAAQIEHWNAAAGKTWAQHQELLDRQIAIDTKLYCPTANTMSISCWTL
jgi:hypothetical protein